VSKCSIVFNPFNSSLGNLKLHLSKIIYLTLSSTISLTCFSTPILGKFENIDDFKAKITENLKSEKEAKNSEKRRISIVEAILEKSEIEVPDMMVDYEVEKMMHEFEGNIATTGMAFDEYLKSINKTKEDYKKEWRDQGFQRAQTQLMLNDIAASEKIDVPDETIQSEVEKIMEQYKNQKGIDENNVRAYVATILTHQEVFKFLDKQ
jgi:FKBP-type peptidyl-prolyl cis-trans isomerase (trigger factor)